jgi:hypothetical protein
VPSRAISYALSVERKWTPSLLDRLVRMDTWAGNYSIRKEMPDASEGEILLPVGNGGIGSATTDS